MSSDDLIKRLPDLMAKATPGPWMKGSNSPCRVQDIHGAKVANTFSNVMREPLDEANAALIALAPTLAATVLRLTAEVAAITLTPPASAGADLVAEAALHRSFPDAGDGRPMPPMGDELMICGLSEADARFVAVQLAYRGLTLRDWRETAINAMDLAHQDYMCGKCRDPAKYTSKFSMAVETLRALTEASHDRD